MHRRLALSLVLSGMGSLGAQVVWARLLAQGLGHETPSVIGTTAAVMAGLGAGSLLWKPGRWGVNPAHAWIRIEVAIALLTVLSAWTVPALCDSVRHLLGPAPSQPLRWAASLSVAALGILPAALAMGATLPVMEALLCGMLREERSFGRLYSLNTLGAVAGCTLAVAWVVPTLGLTAGLVAFSIANLASAVLLRGLQPPSGEAGTDRAGAARVTGRARTSGLPSPGRIQWTLLVSGLLGMGFEIVGLRVLSMVFENTAHSFAFALGVFLAGHSLGGWLYHVAMRERLPADLLSWLLASTAVSLTAGAMLVAPSRGLLGDGAHAPGGELLLCAVVFLLPAVFMGSMFSHLVALARRAGSGVPGAIARSYLGGACGGMVFGVLLLPLLGFKWTILVLAGGYLVMSPHFRLWSWRAGCLLLIAAGVGVPGDLRLVEVPEGARLAEVRVGATATVSVLEEPGGNRSLRVNNRFQMGGTAAALAQRRQAHLPLLLHPSPADALFLGPGTGITLGAATTHPGLGIQAVELIPEVVDVMSRFEPENLGARRLPQVRMIVSDARSFISGSHDSFDVIVADLFHPALDGAGALYTTDHFLAVRQRLRNGGLFCQWLPLHQLSPDVLQLILRSFLSVFSESELWMLHFNVDVPVVALVGRLEPARAGWAEAMDSRMARLPAGELRGAGFPSSIPVLGCFMAGGDGLRELAGRGPLNTDTFPRVTFAAAAGGWRSPGRRGGTLEFVFDGLAGVSPGARRSDLAIRSFAAAGPAAEFMAARDRYLRGLLRESGGSLKDAVEDYFAAIEQSLYFTPAYARLIHVIQLLAPTDPATARAHYERMLRVRPDQPLGRQLLGPLFEAGKPVAPAGPPSQ